MSKIKVFQTMLENGTDNALLRYSLGNAYFHEKMIEFAIDHLHEAVAHDESYSAAWRLLGKCYFENGDFQKAVEIYETGIAVAVKKGDKQAEKEMTVFLRRSQKKVQSKQ